jgi:hypothetical protein
MEENADRKRKVFDWEDVASDAAGEDSVAPPVYPPYVPLVPPSPSTGIPTVTITNLRDLEGRQVVSSTVVLPLRLCLVCI